MSAADMAASKETWVVLATFPTLSHGKKAAEAWVRLRLAACVNIIPNIRSVYLWRGKVERASECLLVAKTTKLRFGALRRQAIAVHPYAVPEVVALAVKQGHEPYLDWVRASVQASSRRRRPGR